MRILQNFLLLSTILIFSACNSSKNKETKTVNKQGKFIKAELGTCDTIKESGVRLSVRFWEPAATDSASVVIHAFLYKMIIDQINECADASGTDTIANTNKSIESAYRVFENNYKAIKAGYLNVPGCWEINLQGDTIMVTPKIIQYQTDHYAFTGAAHPGSFKACYIFNIATGEKMKGNIFIADSVALLKKVEKAFRKAGNVADTTNLENAGYFLSDHKFFLPYNYAFSREGMIFHYNTYEIAPYAQGAITFMIPYKELKGILKEELIF